MKIAHVVGTFFPQVGGMGAVVFDECRKLAEAGHAVTVFTMRYPSLAYHDQAQKFKIVRLSPWIKLGDAGFLPSLLSKLKNFDIVHLHYPFYGGAEWVLLAKLFNQQKYVVTYHMDAAPRGIVKRLVQIVYDFIWARHILRGAAKVLVVDKNYFAASKFASALDLANVVELPNGVDTEVFRPRPSVETIPPTYVGAGRPELLFVGNLMPVKRLDLLFEAMRRLEDTKVILTVVGGGYEEKRYQRMTTDYGLRTTVRFIGVVDDRHELAKYYSSATALVVPSDAESFSLVALEAMACGCPVIASDLPSVRGRVVDGENGFLFTPGSVESLTEKLKRLLSVTEEERKAMGERGRRMVEENYSLTQHADKLETIYQDVVFNNAF